jgi:2-haloacid dehalogenase
LLELPAFPDVKPGLERLKSNRLKLVVLTNSPEKAVKAAVESAGLAGLLDNVLSAEEVKRLKPAPEPYRMAAKKMGVKPRNLLLVAAHAWDVAGAMRAGCRAAFVRRPEQVLDELTPRPDFNVADLMELARILGR